MAKRGPKCRICTHGKRHLIEMGLTLGTPYSVLAARFGLSDWTLCNHKRHHLSPAQQAAIIASTRPEAIDLEQLERCESEGLLGALVAQRARLQQLVELAMELGDIGKGISAEHAIRENLQLVAKLLGQLVQRHEVRSTSILISPDYIQLRQAILAALAPHPEAARAVSRALHALEVSAAEDIAEHKRPLLLEANL